MIDELVGGGARSAGLASCLRSRAFIGPNLLDCQSLFNQRQSWYVLRVVAAVLAAELVVDSVEDLRKYLKERYLHF